MQYNKRIFTIKQCLRVTLKAFEHIGDMTRARKKAGMSKELIKHIMLAVTEVNGCAMCAYGHTKSALEMGMPMEDIEQLLSGGFDHLDKDEAAALMFAQHYAETGGEYSKSAWLRVVDIYGMDKARGHTRLDKDDNDGQCVWHSSRSFVEQDKRQAR